MGTNDYSNMSEEQLNEFISALADEDSSGLSDEQVDFLQHAVRERPELFGEYRLNIATKLCLMKHGKHVRCPESTAESIRSILYHVHKTRQASL
jgi:hypothetical protein